MFLPIIQIVRDFIETVSLRYRTMMLNLSRSITGNEQDAEEVVQDALMILHRKQDILKDVESKGTRSYIYVVTRNLALSYRERAKKRADVVTNMEDAVLLNIEGEVDIDAFSDVYGFSDKIAEALKQLKQEERDLICLHYGAGYTYAEIAELMDAEPAALRKRRQRLREKLLKELERGGEQP